MDFVKKHYEKVLLAVVLLGLVGALVFLPFLITRDQEQLQRISQVVLHQTVKRLPDLDLSRQSNVVARLRSPYVLDFSTTNKLFNPLQWMRKPDGTFVPAKPGLVGPEATVVTKIIPLYLILTLDSLDTNSAATNESGALCDQRGTPGRRRAGAAGQTAALCVGRGKGQKDDVFTIREVSGSPADPGR